MHCRALQLCLQTSFVAVAEQVHLGIAVGTCCLPTSVSCTEQSKVAPPLWLPSSGCGLGVLFSSCQALRVCIVATLRLYTICYSRSVKYHIVARWLHAL